MNRVTNIISAFDDYLVDRMEQLERQLNEYIYERELYTQYHRYGYTNDVAHDMKRLEQ
jgi:hypothetical protein